MNICYTRYLSLIIEHLLGEAYVNDNLKPIKPYHITEATFKPLKISEVPLTSYMRKVSQLSKDPKKSLILPSKEVNSEDTVDKSSSRTAMHPIYQPKVKTDKRLRKKKTPSSYEPKASNIVMKQTSKTPATHTQLVEETKAPADATQSLEASNSVEEQEIQPQNTKAKKSIEAIKEKLESLYETESEIKFIKSFKFVNTDEDQITFLGSEPINMEIDQTEPPKKNASEETYYGLQSMHADELASLSGFEALNSDMKTQSDSLGHLQEELHTLNTKVDQLESKVTDNIQTSVPSLIADALKAHLPSLIPEAFKESLSPLIQDSIQQTIQRFVTLQKELSNVIKAKMGKSIREKVRKRMETVFDKLAAVQSTVATNSQHVQNLRLMFKDIVDLLEAAKVFKKANAEGENYSPTPPREPTPTRDMNPLKDESKGKGEDCGIFKEDHYPANIRAQAQKIAKYEAKGLGIPPPPELPTFRLYATEKKRKRTSEILEEVFVKENIVVDGMHKNLIPPPGVEGKRGLVIREPESWIFFTMAEEMFKKLELTIEARDDANQARNMTCKSGLSNSFGGVILQCVRNISSSLTLMDLGTNLFQGTIPNVFEEFTQLEGHILNGNQLEGEVPHSLSNCRSLKVLDIRNNKLNGTFLEWLGGLSLLQVLVLKTNSFHGPIETSTAMELAFSSLQVLDLSHNWFAGKLPGILFQNFKAMQNMVRRSTEPEYLFIRGNYYSIIEGEIPNTTGNISGIESLDLSWNQLIGEIPQSLVEIKGLAVLNLSENQLMGRIPKGTQFNTFDESSFEGNSGLCGLPLTKMCSEHTHKPQLESQEEESGFT
nr:leucine-rich repeat-containing protein [Tanacetum cinerariifolium]GEY33614.1 leucine-rich repeat-containing protein [Tanacetum cinerariifolium]